MEDPAALSRLHGDRLIQRDIDQLLGICEFALQDGHIDQDEAENILIWLNNHRECIDTWPAKVIYDRLQEALSDGILDDEEQRDLLGLVLSIAKPPRPDQGHTAASLPLNTPQPPIDFTGRSFCFTGVFDFGSRNECHAATEGLGGIPAQGITKKLHYLVIGNIGSQFWRHTSFGSKIAKAVEYRDNGLPIAIITEEHWRSYLK